MTVKLRLLIFVYSIMKEKKIKYLKRCRGFNVYINKKGIDRTLHLENVKNSHLFCSNLTNITLFHENFKRTHAWTMQKTKFKFAIKNIPNKSYPLYQS